MFCLHKFPHAVTEVRDWGTELPMIVGKALCGYVRMYVGMYVCVCVYIYIYIYTHTGPALSQLDQLLPIGPCTQFYRPWCKLTGNLRQPKLFPTPPKAGPECIYVYTYIYIYIYIMYIYIHTEWNLTIPHPSGTLPSPFIILKTFD